MKPYFDLTIIQPVISACHENWNEMLPHEKGAFCKSCNKVVNDLSTLNASQLAEFLIANEGNQICGRIKSDLLNIPVAFLERHQHTYSFNFFFVLALFLSFGPLLFSCDEKQHEELSKSIVETLESQVETAPEIVSEIEIEKKSKTPVIKPTLQTQPLYVEDYSDVVIQDTLPEVVITSRFGDIEIAGGMSFIRRTISSVKLDTTVAEHQIAKNPESLPLLVYPNPASEQVTINYSITEEGIAILSVFDIRGQKIKDIVSINDAHAGSYSEMMDVSDLPSGMYIVILINNDKKEIFRLSVTH